MAETTWPHTATAVHQRRNRHLSPAIEPSYRSSNDSCPSLPSEPLTTVDRRNVIKNNSNRNTRRAFSLMLCCALTLYYLIDTNSINYAVGDVKQESLNRTITYEKKDWLTTINNDDKTQNTTILNTRTGSSHEQKYLVADLAGGITNQMKEIWVSLLIAERLNRTLVMPELIVRLPKEHKFASKFTARPEPFHVIWDEEHFVQCAREKLNRPDLMIESDTAHYIMAHYQDHTYYLQMYDNVDNFTPIFYANASSNELVSRLMNDSSKYVRVYNPFSLTLDLTKWNYQQCFESSAELKKQINHYKSILPANYSCLHARTEEDWYSVGCCKPGKSNTTSIDPELWTCSEFNHENCYMTPAQIAGIMKENLPLNSPLCISSGSSKDVLRPIYDSFEVFSKNGSSSAFMDYSLAEVRAIVPH